MSQTAVLGQLFLQNAHKYASMKARVGGPPIPRAATVHLAETLKALSPAPLDDSTVAIVPTLAH